MDNGRLGLYTDARRYDLVSGAYATGEFLDYYRRQIARYGQPVLELACGSGRLTIPLAEDGVNITGLDLSDEMLALGRLKASERGTNVRFVSGDIRRFDLREQFKVIFIPVQSLTHLFERQDIEDCLDCVRRHLTGDGRFLIELHNPSMKLLARGPDR